MGWPKINQIDQLGLSEKAKRIFAWKFFAGESFADWPGPENYMRFTKKFLMLSSIKRKECYCFKWH